MLSNKLALMGLRPLTLSRQQLTRLIAQYRKTGRLQRCQRTVSGFKSKYTEKDTRLLAAMDERHVAG